MKLATVATRFSCFSAVLVPMLALQPCLEARAADSSPHSAPVRHVVSPAALFQTAQVKRAPSHHLASAADPTDPYIVAQAAALNNDPNQIFNFVRDKIAFQAYHGSVRGARGTLWSMGGNSLDKSSLLIALLGAAGQSAQYVQGRITNAQEQTLLGSMFSAPWRVVGCIPPNTTLADPVNDPTLQGAISDHYWVEYGASNTPMDPSFPGAQAGTAYGTPATTFTVANMPAALKQMVAISLNVETASVDEFSSPSLSSPLGGSPLFTESYESALLVGMPISLNNTLTGGTSSFFGITTTTFTYTPTLLLGQGSGDVELDPVKQEPTFQESYAPGGFGANSATWVTGLFLIVAAPNAQGITQTYTHTIADLLGYANRQANPTSPNITAPNILTPSPIVAPTDVVTINVLPGLQSAAAYTNQQARVQTEQARFQAQQAALAALPTSGSLTTQQQTTLSQGIATEAYLQVTLNELVTMTFASTADYMLPQVESTYLSDAYYNSPRIIIGAANSSGNFSLDLMKRDIKVVASPGQNSSAPYYFEFARGMAESSSEPKILNEVLSPQSPAIGIADVFAKLPQGGAVYIDNTLFGDGLVQMPNLSADAQAYIKTAFQNNKAVVAPATTPAVNGESVNMWLEIDHVTGETVSMSDDGNHEGVFGWIIALTTFFFGKYFTFTQIAGFGATGYAFAAGVLTGVAAIAGGAKYSKGSVACIQGGACSTSPLAPYVIAVFKDEKEYLQNNKLCPQSPLAPDTLPPSVDGVCGLIDGMEYGALASQNVFLRMLPADPDVYTFLSSDIIPGPAAVPPGNTPSVKLTLAQDQFFTQPFSGGDVPTVFLANIQNTGPSAQTFNLTVTPPAGYSIIQSVPAITVPAGRTGQIGICAVPTGATAPPATLSASVTAADNANVTSSNTAPVTPQGDLTACEVTKDTLPTVADVQFEVNQALGAGSLANDLNTSGAVNVVDVQIVINSVVGNGCKL